MTLSSILQKRVFILGSFVVLLLAVLLYWRINALVGSFRQIDHTTQIELKLEYTLSYLKDAETAQRGFLLTKDSTFLEPFYGARQRIDKIMTEIEALTKDNPTQQQNFYSLQLLIDRRFNLLNTTLSVDPAAADTLRSYLKLGKATMDRIRVHVERMKAVEQNLLKQHEGLKNRYVRLTPLSLLFLVFAMLAIIGFSYYGLTRQLLQTKKMASDLDHSNNELLLKNKQLENSVEELNSFNYIASHDLKEPLRKILFFTDVITGQDGTLSADTKHHLDKIHTSGARMKSLLDDLLTYAQASMSERKKEPVDLNAVMEAALESLSEVLKAKDANVAYENLPQIEAVPSQIQQLFENLITNSVKYCKAGVQPRITVRSHLVSKKDVPSSFEATYNWYQELQFCDNGIGFTQENAEKIFMLFQRLHQRHEFSGTGIGLTICKKIVQNHDGFIKAKSEVEKGTTFFIYLPA